MKLLIKPLSVNQAWKGRRFKTDEYKSYAKQLALILKPIKIDFNSQLRLDVVFGFSSHGSDLDNPLKPLLDVLQNKYGINDNKIYELFVKKEIVKKGNEFIELNISSLEKS
jgi:Holliday junction resolvase RusA-like endonuclease